MKKIMWLCVAGALVLTGLCGKERIMQPEEIPAEIVQYTDQHFSGQKIIQAQEDRDGVKISYDIVLDNGAVLEFNSKKEITEIESVGKLPDSAIPPVVLEYVVKNYPAESILCWERDKKTQSVKLTNRLELVFTLKGDFIKIDR